MISKSATRIQQLEQHSPATDRQCIQSKKKMSSFYAVNRDHFYKYSVGEKKQVPGIGHYKPNPKSLQKNIYHAKISDETNPEKQKALAIKAYKRAIPVNLSKKLEKALSLNINPQFTLSTPRERAHKYFKSSAIIQKFKRKLNQTSASLYQNDQLLATVNNINTFSPSQMIMTDLDGSSPLNLKEQLQSTRNINNNRAFEQTTLQSASVLKQNPSAKNTIATAEETLTIDDGSSSQRPQTITIPKRSDITNKLSILGSSSKSPLNRNQTVGMNNNNTSLLLNSTLRNKKNLSDLSIAEDISKFTFQTKKIYANHCIVKQIDDSESVVPVRSPDKALTHSPRAFFSQLTPRKPFVTQQDPPHAMRFDNIEKIPSPHSKAKHVRGFRFKTLTSRRAQLFNQIQDQPDYEPKKDFILPKRVVGVLGFKGQTSRLMRQSIYKQPYDCISINQDQLIKAYDKQAHRRQQVLNQTGQKCFRNVKSPKFDSVPGRNGKALTSDFIFQD